MLCHSLARGRAPALHAWRPGGDRGAHVQQPKSVQGGGSSSTALEPGTKSAFVTAVASCQTSWTLGVLTCKMKIIVHVPRLVRIIGGGVCRASGEPETRAGGSYSPYRDCPFSLPLLAATPGCSSCQHLRLCLRSFSAAAEGPVAPGRAGRERASMPQPLPQGVSESPSPCAANLSPRGCGRNPRAGSPPFPAPFTAPRGMCPFTSQTDNLGLSLLRGSSRVT